ncbi:MAG: zinc-ribbon domain-containing protein [Methanoregula sp.]|jgi:ribosomal protein L32
MTENQKKCQKCGNPVAPGLKFCESCGAKIESLPVCPKCGAALNPNVKFCETCGAPASPTDAPVIPAPPEPVPVAAPAVVPPVVKEPDAAPAPVAVPPAEPPQKAEERPVPAPEENPVPPAEPVKDEEKAALVSAEKPAPVSVKEPQKIEKIKEVPKETGPKKPMSQTTMIIAGVIVLALLGAAVFFVVLPMLSGSATPSPTQPVSPGGTNSGTTTTNGAAIPAGTVSLTVGPTDVPPSNRALIIDVEKNAISRDIIVTFQGGEGQYGVRELAITLTRSDGTVETQSLSHLERGSSITMKGTDKDDRVEVTANFYNGETYKIVDKVFEYKKRVGSS